MLVYNLLGKVKIFLVQLETSDKRHPRSIKTGMTCGLDRKRGREADKFKTSFKWGNQKVRMLAIFATIANQSYRYTLLASVLRWHYRDSVHLEFGILEKILAVFSGAK